MHTTTLDQPGFGKAPEPFDTIDVAGRCGKFIAAMIDPQVLGIAQVHQSVIASPAVTMDDAIQANFTSYSTLKGLFRGIRDNLCVDFSIAFKDTEDDGFSAGSPASFAFDATSSEVRFIDFNLTTEGGLRFTKHCYALTDRLQIFVN